MITIKILKKILKVICILFFIFIIFVIIDLLNSKITSVEDISDLKKIKMYDSNGNVFYEINNLEESSYIELNKINENTIKTFIEIEDKRFYDHSGFDIYRIGKALINNIQKDSIIGASTITQQYIKNIYLTSEKSIFRKIREIYYSIKLETIYEKNEILEGYLNTIYFNHGVYGIYDAAKYYFNKEPIDLTLAESACLVAIIKAPAKYSPVVDFNKNETRKNLILKTLLKNNKITQEEYIKAINQKITITKTKYNPYNSTVLFYKDLVLSEIKKMALNSNNIDIYTSFDSKINQDVEDYIKANPIYSNLSIIILNNKGEIILSTSKNYKENSLNVGITSERMIGSTIKPFLYYEALNNGMNSLSKFKSEKTTFYINKTPYNIKNYNDKYENKKITMGYAIATSDNIYAIKTHLYLGSNKLIGFLNNFDIEVKDNFPSLALGTLDISLLKLTSIYNTFSRLGEYNDPYAVNKIKVNETNYYIKRNKIKSKLNPSISFIINELLSNTFDTNMSNVINVTGSSIADRLITKTSAKSGLTDFDSYMIGYTPYYTIGIWTGNNDNSLLTDTISKEFPKKIFLYIINKLMEENKNIWYEKPNDVYALFTDPTGFNTGYEKNVYFIN